VSNGPTLSADHPLAGCEAKIWRAHEHFEALQTEIAREFGSGEAQLFATRGELEATTEDVSGYVISVSEVFPPPIRYATIIGDIVHNLRSALDHLVFELSFLGLSGKSLPRRVAYPCSTTRQNWHSKYVQQTLLAGVMQKHRAMIYRTQPCYRKKDSASPGAVRRRKRHPLSDLDNLWKHDKHRMIQPVAVAPLTTQCRIVDHPDCEIVGTPTLNRAFFGERLQVNTEIVTIPIRIIGANPHVNVQFEGEGEGEIGFRNGLPARESLAAIGDWVKTLLAWFEPEFNTPRPRRLWGLPRGDWIDTSPFRRVQAVWVTGDDPHDRPTRDDENE
jgi:hypothetical protein